MEEGNLGNIAIALAFICIISALWKAINSLWLRPKRLEKCLRKQGFKGNSYRLRFVDKDENGDMLKKTLSKPMEHFSNDYVPRILPSFQQTIKDYGERSFIWNGPTPVVSITEPELIREVLMKIRDFPKSAKNPLIKKLSNGLAMLEGDEWDRDRKLLNPAFHIDKLKHMLPAFYASFRRMVDEWEKMASKTGSHEIEIWSSLHNTSADAISRAAFGSSFEEGRKVFELLRQQIAIIISSSQPFYIPGWRLLPTKAKRMMEKNNKEIQAVLKTMIYRRKQAMEAGEEVKDDLLTRLLKSSFEGIEDRHQHRDYNMQKKLPKLSLKQVIEECKLFYLAGQETTSGLLVWALILLSKHQQWQERAREEILNIFGDSSPDFDGLKQLNKVNMILHEVLRLYPAVTVFTRVVSHNITIGDIQLEPGMLINLPIVYVQHDEKLWGSDAKEFNPERFSDGILKATQGNMSFFSFGWGPRTCLGSNFAMLEAKMALVLILQRFSLHLSPSYTHAPTMGFGTLRPQFGAKVIINRL